MKRIHLLLILSFTIGAMSCKEDPKLPLENAEDSISTFYFIRHAEKDRSDPENIDPELNQDGLGRAIRWAEVFDPVALDAIYITDFERTAMTAAPTSVKKEITPQYYDPKALIIEEFKNLNLGKNVLIVGHSNTTPEFVNLMLGEEKYEHMDDYDNSSLFIVRIINGKATDIRLKMD
ncbi:SixA phosphatase family protein [Arenibacter troitsensis]|uniref:Histidine phosphatase superfamily (Branch 1) n=1 Tax=Arenibacter troitsensis TaxID=188872 RepID=A0A1X7JHW5_9FLAO|nr:phosphoglycerate mutase family protein [Arenibacter troitsensis]SMG27691.1 Histidine phosphatase superfamily (branch 1) [Arenibacter troitsensis]